MMKPCNAKNETEFLRLRRDNLSTEKAWIVLTDKGVTIAEQESGKLSTGMVRLSRKDFRQFASWYLKDQKAKP